MFPWLWLWLLGFGHLTHAASMTEEASPLAQYAILIREGTDQAWMLVGMAVDLLINPKDCELVLVKFDQLNLLMKSGKEFEYRVPLVK